MYKKFLLILFAALMVLGAGAQSRRSDAPRPLQQLSLSRMDPKVSVQAMQRHTPGSPVTAPARSTASLVPFYRRPAGGFYCHDFILNGEAVLSYNYDIVLLKPFADYTINCTVEGADENTVVLADIPYADGSWDFLDDLHDSFTVSYNLSIQDMPTIYAVDGDPDDYSSVWYKYQMPYFYKENPGGFVEERPAAKAFAIPSSEIFPGDDEEEYLLSSKTICLDGRNQDLDYMWISYIGYPYFPPDFRFWWFGKNDGHYDGIAQAFEKPEHPYLLKKVYLFGSVEICLAPVKLTCKVYKLDEVPSYQDTSSVILPEVPGELIAVGEGMVTPETQENYGYIGFELQGMDEDDPQLLFDYFPTVDYPILVVIEGYNDPEAAALEKFTAYISADYHVDEGYGETAYLKCPINDEDDNFTGHYEWRGLNNFFSVGEMKTAYSIFIVADQPFITFNYIKEDGEYIFPVEGGLMEKDLGGVTTRSIEFFSWFPGADGGWTVTCNGDDPPEWLNIKLIDGEDDGVFNYIVTAEVVADPLPEGVAYREAVVRFESPGAYIDYKFMQGEKIVPPLPCFFEDNELTIADINHLIDLILSDMYDDCYDVNEDGELNVADVNAIIDYLVRL